jgi:hypothetical protein
VEEFKNVQSNATISKARKPIQTPPKWTAPTDGWLKENLDVAIDKNNGRVGIGVVVRVVMRD